MSWSLNEVDAMAKKALRGAGYSWGMAEEAGKATRWLCARDLDGCGALLDLLENTDGTALTEWGPIIDGPDWRARGDLLCPLITGAAISDFAHKLRDTPIRCGNIIQPILLVPFVATAAWQNGATLTLSCRGMTAITDGRDLCITGAPPAGVDELTITSGGQLGTLGVISTRAQAAPATWAALGQFAQRTFAPASEESRRKGAGSGLSDND